MEKKLYVGNLNVATTTDEVKELFAIHGVVEEATVLEGKGFGFVEMSNQAESEAARKALDGFDYKGRKLMVNMARPPKTKSFGRRGR